MNVPSRTIWFKILLLIFGLILIGLGVSKILSPSLPAGYKETLSTIGSESTALGELFKELPQSLSGLEEKEAASQWAAAAQIVEDALDVVEGISVGTASFKTNIASFKNLSARIRKSDAKKKSLHLADLLEQMALRLEEIVNLERQILEPTREYYEDLAAGRTATLPSNIDTLTVSLTTKSTELSDLAEEAVTATNELYDLLGISPTQ